MDGAGKDEEIIGQAVSWVIDHVVAEANFEGVDVLLIGDPLVLADAPPLSGTLVGGVPFRFMDLPNGRALAVAGPGEGDGPWVWVVGSDDGPLASIDISPHLADPGPQASSEDVGAINLPSGRIVVGTPESVAHWGRDVGTSSSEILAERRSDWHVPGFLRDGYIIVVKVQEGGECRVVVTPTDSGGVSAISVRFPIPGWLPLPRPIVEKG